MLKFNKKRIGVFVGTFDPPHIGHRNLTIEIMNRFSLDTVYVYPDSVPTYKLLKEEIHHRQNMLDLMFENVDGVISRPPPQLEVQPGKERLWDIHDMIKSRFNDQDVFIIMGNDTFNWYSNLLSKQKMNPSNIIVSRRDSNKDKIPETLNEGSVHSFIQNDQMLSSTKVKEKLKSNIWPEEIPPSIQRYIKIHYLYGVQNTKD